MTSIELKSKIISKVHAIEDEEILKEIYDLIKIESEIDTIYHVSEIEKKAIEAGLKDIENGKVVSSEKANELIRQWLKK